MGAMKMKYLGNCCSIIAISWLSLNSVSAREISRENDARSTESGSQPAFDDTADAPASGNDIVVTANKRQSTTVLKAPSAIQAISGTDLLDQGVVSFEDVAGQVPGLAVQNLGPGDRKYVIRGVSSTGASTTGVYYDEAVISGSNANDGGGLQSDIRLYDLERIEVLRGPQGTLYGAGSMSGTIRFITNKPDLDDFSGYVKGEISTTRKGGENYNINGALNLPIVENKIALRLVGWGVDDSGFVDQVRVGTGSPDPLGRVSNVNNDKVLGGRAILRVKPVDDLTIDLSYTRQRQESQGSSRYTPAGITAYSVPGTPTIQGCDLCNTDVNLAPRKDNLEIFSATANYRTSFGTFTATTNQFNRKFLYSIDTTAILFQLGIPYPSLTYEYVDRKLNSSELRFASDFDFPVNFVVGGFRQGETSNLEVNVLSTNGIGKPRGGFSTLNSMDALLFPDTGSTFYGRTDRRKSVQYAAFGEVAWDVVSGLELTAGIRYFHETLNGVQQTLHPFGGFPDGETSEPPVVNEEQSNSKLTYKFNAGYTVSTDLLIYATVSSGFRSGGLNPPSPFAPIPPSFKSDNLWNYEFGIKGKLFGGGLEYQADAFYIDWKGIQVQQATPEALPYLGNAGNARIKGFEFELVARPTDSLTVNFAGSIQDAYLKEGATPDQLAINPTLGVSGDKLPDVAPFQFAVGLNYTTPLSSTSDWSATLAADVNYQGKRNAYFQNSPFNIELKSYTLVDLRASISNDLWTVSVFARNLTDKRAQLSAINSAQDPYALITARPRTFGLSVLRNF